MVGSIHNCVGGLPNNPQPSPAVGAKPIVKPTRMSGFSTAFVLGSSSPSMSISCINGVWLNNDSSEDEKGTTVNFS